MNYKQLNDFKDGIQSLDKVNRIGYIADNFKKYIASPYYQIGNVAEQLGDLHD